MLIQRYCGKEKLPGGERRWRRLARAADFHGRVEVYGYGVFGVPGRKQRLSQRTGVETGVTIANFRPGRICVWLPCVCAAAEFDADLLAYNNEDPLTSFAHELGHHRQHVRGRERWDQYAESGAERYGRMLLRRVA